MAGKKYWDVMYTLCPSTSLQMPNIELHRPGIEPGPPDRMWTLYHWAMESVHKMGVPMSQYFSPNAKYWTASSRSFLNSGTLIVIGSQKEREKGSGHRASDFQCQSRKSHGFNPSILRHSGSDGRGIRSSVDSKKSRVVSVIMTPRNYA